MNGEEMLFVLGNIAMYATGHFCHGNLAFLLLLCLLLLIPAAWDTSWIVFVTALSAAASFLPAHLGWNWSLEMENKLVTGGLDYKVK